MLFAGRVIRPLAASIDVDGTDNADGTDNVDGADGTDNKMPADEVPGVASWVSSFVVDHVRTEEPPSPSRLSRSFGTWRVFAPDRHPLAEPLRAALTESGTGDGVLLCLPDSGEDHLALILAAGKAAAASPGHRFVVVQHRFGAAAFARTLHLAAPSLPTTVVDLVDPAPTDPVELADAVRRVVAEVAATSGFTEVYHDRDGTRTVPVLRALPRQAGVIVSSPLGTTDVLL